MPKSTPTATITASCHCGGGRIAPRIRLYQRSRRGSIESDGVSCFSEGPKEATTTIRQNQVLSEQNRCLEMVEPGYGMLPMGARSDVAYGCVDAVSPTAR